jgi:hypothetical protein
MAVAALISAGAAAVGVAYQVSESDPKVSSTTASVDDTWVREANGICAEVNERLHALLGPEYDAFPPSVPRERPPKEQLVAFVEQALPLANEALARFRSLSPPEGEESTVVRMIDLLEQSVTSFQNASSAIQNGDSATTENLLADGLDRDQRASEIARGLGAHRCDTP